MKSPHLDFDPLARAKFRKQYDFFFLFSSFYMSIYSLVAYDGRERLYTQISSPAWGPLVLYFCAISPPRFQYFSPPDSDSDSI